METYLSNAIWNFRYYKSLGEKAIAQLADDKLNVQLNDESNSIALIVKHLEGNMLSRWTDFLTTDGEKPSRQRDGEFEGGYDSRAELLAAWERGWMCLFDALESLTDADLNRTIFIRNEGLLVVEAINRQLAHYGYHVGQIVFLAKVLAVGEWKTLSIARRKSQSYNAAHFEKLAQRKDFDAPNFYDAPSV